MPHLRSEKSPGQEKWKTNFEKLILFSCQPIDAMHVIWGRSGGSVKVKYLTLTLTEITWLLGRQEKMHISQQWHPYWKLVTNQQHTLDFLYLPQREGLRSRLPHCLSATCHYIKAHIIIVFQFKHLSLLRNRPMEFRWSRKGFFLPSH